MIYVRKHQRNTWWMWRRGSIMKGRPLIIFMFSNNCERSQIIHWILCLLLEQTVINQSRNLQGAPILKYRPLIVFDTFLSSSTFYVIPMNLLTYRPFVRFLIVSKVLWHTCVLWLCLSQTGNEYLLLSNYGASRELYNRGKGVQLHQLSFLFNQAAPLIHTIVISFNATVL